jgi:hypothetical protein
MPPSLNNWPVKPLQLATHPGSVQVLQIHRMPSAFNIARLLPDAVTQMMLLRQSQDSSFAESLKRVVFPVRVETTVLL